MFANIVTTYALLPNDETSKTAVVVTWNLRHCL